MKLLSWITPNCNINRWQQKHSEHHVLLLCVLRGRKPRPAVWSPVSPLNIHSLMNLCVHWIFSRLILIKKKKKIWHASCVHLCALKSHTRPSCSDGKSWHMWRVSQATCLRLCHIDFFFFSTWCPTEQQDFLSHCLINKCSATPTVECIMKILVRSL